MVEFKSEELPDAVRLKPLRLGCCPHGVTIVTGTEIYVDYPQFLWNLRKETGKKSYKSSDDLTASAKVSLFWGLAKGHIKYDKHKAADRNKNSKTTHVTLRIQTGIKSLMNVKPTPGGRCSKGGCRGQPFYVSSVCVGGEASLTLWVDAGDDSEALSQGVGGGLSLFGMGREMEPEESAIETNGHLQMRALYSSSIEEPVMIVSNSQQEVARFMEGLKELEQRMLLFQKNIFELGLSDKLNSKYIFEPLAKLFRNEILDGIQLKLDARSKFERVLDEVLDVRKECERMKNNDKVDHFARKIDVIIKELKDLQHTDHIDIDKVMEIYGDHAVNFYTRELRRLAKL